MAEVTQADREAAEKWTRARCRGLGISEAGIGAIAETIARGDADDDDLAQAFARHRTEAVKPLVEALELFAAIKIGTDADCTTEIVPNGYSDPRKWREHVEIARAALRSVQS